jgi:hypothetical protein
MSIATDVDTARQWCLEARKILGKKLIGTSDNTRMKEAAKHVRNVLQDVSTKLPQKLYDELEKEFRELAGKARDIDKSGDSPQKKAKDLDPIVKGLIDLDGKVSAASGKFDKYTKLKIQAGKRRDELANLNFENLKFETEVADAIQTAKQKAENDPFDYDEGIKELEKTDGLFKKGKEEAKKGLKSSEMYKKELPKAEEKLRELKTLKHGKTEYHAEVEDAIKKADDEAGKDPADFAAAVDELEKVDSLYEKAKKEAETTVKGELSTVEHKPVYEDKVGRIKTAIKELEKLPGAGKQVKKLQDLLDAGDSELKSSKNYEEAFKKLSGLSGALKEGRESHEKLLKSGGKGFPARGQALEAIKEFDKLAGLNFPKDVAAYRKRYDDCLRTLEGDPDESVMQKAVTEMEGIRDDVKGRADKIRKRREVCDEAWKTASEAVYKVKVSAPLDVYEKVFASFREGEALRSTHRPITARKKFEATTLDAEKEIKIYYKKYEDWNKISTEVDKNYLAELQEVNEGTIELAVAKNTQPILTTYATARDVMDRTREFDEGVKAAQAVKDTVTKTIRPALKAYKEMEEIRAKAIKSNDEVKASVLVRIGNLEKERGDGEDFREDVRHTWEDFIDVCKSSIDKNELERAIKTCHDKLFDIGKKLGDLLNNKDGSLDVHKTTAEPKVVKKEFDGKLKELGRLIEGLAAEFPGDAKPFQKQLDDVFKKVAAPAKEDFEKVATAVEEVGKKKAEREEERKVAAGEVDKLGEKCVEAAKKLRSGHKQFKDYLDEVDLEIKDLVSMSQSSVKSAVLEGKKRLEAMLLELPKKGAALDKVAERIAGAEKKLDDSNAKKLYPLRVKTLKARLESVVQPECYKSDPETAEKTLKAFEDDLQLLADSVQKAADTRKDVDKLAGEIRDSLKKQLEDSPKLKASFEDRIKAAETPAENGETKAFEDLKKLKKLVDKCCETTKEGESLRTTLEQRATEQEFRDSKAEKEWIAALAVFEKNTQRSVDDLFKKMARAERNSKAYKAIATELKEAKKLAGKKSFDQAVERLADARKAADRFTANPFSAATTARRSLGKVEQRWSGDVAKYVHKLNNLCDKITEDLKTDGKKDDEIAATLAPIRKLAGLFDSEIFKGIVETLSKKLPKATTDICKAMPKRRSAKELGLRHVLRYQQAVENNPLLSLLEEHNPFLSPAESDFRSGIADCLRDLELNLKRA